VRWRATVVHTGEADEARRAAASGGRPGPVAPGPAAGSRSPAEVDRRLRRDAPLSVLFGIRRVGAIRLRILLRGARILGRIIGVADQPLLDDINKKIIEALQRDGRMSYAALAKVVGLSEAAVRQRMQRMLDSDVMQIVAVTDPLSLGFSRQVMIGLRVQGDMRTVADALAALPEVDYVVICAGAYDLLVEVVCTDDDHLFTMLNDKIRSIPGVTGTETFVYLKLAKQTYAWGTR
jgi:Lrp/AsnC family transcriptional regulator for asnA, asnC and gidA